jgi:hypothetical protein
MFQPPALLSQSAMPLFSIPFETDPNRTLTYDELLDCYRKLADAYPKQFRLEVAGNTDIGEPLHIAILSKDGVFDPEAIRPAGKRILMINNGIHPGEPEGIDATVLLLRDLLESPERQKVLEQLVIVAIPVYNVDGCLNRNSFTRANQEGPSSYGFRGNARNLDLNRDFIKCDSRNAQSFNRIFQNWQPDVFIDNHTSNGADYQYTMTLIPTLPDKLEAPLGKFLEEQMLPSLFEDMQRRGWEMTPYVDGFTDTPDGGLVAFCDYGRYSTGYAALWNTIGFMTETHMLKPFSDRLHSTYAFMEAVITFMHSEHTALGKAREAAIRQTKEKNLFVLDWKVDTGRHEQILFKGYAAKYKPSEVSGLPRLYYDRNEPFEKNIPYYNRYIPTLSIQKPYAYIIPQAWGEVLERLQLNNVRLERLREDCTLKTENYYIRDFETRNAWEGHYYHHKIKVEASKFQRTWREGDYVVFTDQPANRYLVESLEPQGPDSWFAWNFFDPILMQKEYFSAYVFEDLAAQFLQENPEIRAQLEAKKKSDPQFAASASKQLDWVYRQSPWYEPSHRLYPVARLNHKLELPLQQER